MVCKGICWRHKAIRPLNGQRYLIGQKRCQVCQIFIDWEGIFCPCCGYKLRVTPRNRKLKQTFRNLKN
jgi:rRNA maturation endonuclease Nob1